MNKTEADLQVAWAAGLFEGEGTIYKRKGRGVKIRVSMTDKEVVDKFAGIFGISVYRRCHAYGKSKEQWEAVTESKTKVNEIVCQMYPFLCRRRREQIENVLGRAFLLERVAA